MKPKKPRLRPVPKTNASTSAKADLFRYIQSLEKDDDVKLPAETELAAKLGVSRVTLRRVLAELEQEGLVLRMHGRGTFVNPEAFDLTPNLMLGLEFLDLLRSCGYEARTEVVGFRRAPADERAAELLRVDVGAELYVVEKVYYADEAAAIVSIDVFPCEIVGDGLEPADVGDPSVFDALLRLGGRYVERDKIRIEAVPRSSVVQSRACRERMTCESVLVFSTVNYDQENHPVLVAVEYYDTSIVKFNCMRVRGLP